MRSFLRRASPADGFLCPVMLMRKLGLCFGQCDTHGTVYSIFLVCRRVKEMPAKGKYFKEARLWQSKK